MLSFFKATIGSIVAEGKLGFKSAWRLFVLLGQLFCLLQFVKRTPSQTIHLELITLLTAIFPSQSYLTSFLSNPRTVGIFSALHPLCRIIFGSLGFLVLLLKIIFSSQQNELSDLNKTYFDISNGQKFELLMFSSF